MPSRPGERFPLGFDFNFGRDLKSKDVAESYRELVEPGPWVAKLVARYFAENTVETVTIEIAEDEAPTTTVEEAPATELDRILAEELDVVQRRDQIRREAEKAKAAAEAADEAARTDLEEDLDAIAEEKPEEPYGPAYRKVVDGYADGRRIEAWHNEDVPLYGPDSYRVRYDDEEAGIENVSRLRDGGTTIVSFLDTSGGPHRLVFPRQMSSDDRRPRLDGEVIGAGP